MLVKNWMTRCVITVDTNDYMIDAIILLKQHNIHRLPVMESGKLVGIVSDKDLVKTSVSDSLSQEMVDTLYHISKIKVSEIMSKYPITIPEGYTVDEAADVFLKNKISGAPVTNSAGEMVGILTHTDLMKVWTKLGGLERKGISFAFLSKDPSCSLRMVADLIRKYGGRILCVHHSHKNVPEGFCEVYTRTYGIERQRFQELKEELEQSVNLLYMVDHSENKRIIYRTGKF